jgi:transglutaminase-like putative cysteine protease
MNKEKCIAIYLSVFLIVSAGCNKANHFITDKVAREQVTTDFQSKQAILPNGDLFSIFNEQLTGEEREALAFLYAYMPLGDITDYSGDFYLKNIRATFQAKTAMPWGKEIPEMIFRHFVLPIRVNNENLDESRMLFYDELKDRVKGLSLYDAVLEVNHWCHEKVIYTPSDARTSSPLASVKTAYGRCGEESVFTVAALRSVGIPARQVYTPRWAHTDDNHAWVEAWVDGKWHFLGACEPEPVLDMGWFNGPAFRGMLMHTKVFGSYKGPEEIMETTGCYTEINVTENYAPTAQSTITITDAGGAPVSDARVEFKVYNYAEFYTVANRLTNAEGKTFLSAGKGDMLVWATKDGWFGFGKVSFGKDADVSVALDKKPGDTFDLPLDIIPPVDGSIPAQATEKQKEENARRMGEEDVIRNQYTATFYTEDKARSLANELGTDLEKTTKFLLGSRGNWMEIENFLRSASADKLPAAMALLEAVSAKDLRDRPALVFTDHLVNSSGDNSRLFYDYVQNPRVRNELVTGYRSFFLNAVPAELASQAKENPHVLAEWVKKNISINDVLNPQRIPVMPMGVWNARVADTNSRNIFFVAVARSLGIPARIEPVAGKVQYFVQPNWVDVDFEASAPIVSRQGKVEASYTPVKALDDPKYYSHFTIAKIRPDGKLQTLDFEAGNQVDMGLGDTWSQLFKKPLPLDEGNYILVTGARMANGNVLAQLSSFRIIPGETTKISLVMRGNQNDIQVIGSINAEETFRPNGSGEEKSILSVAGRGYFVIGILGARQEPTNHAMRDIAAVTKDLEEWNRSIILLFKDEQGWKNFDATEFGTLPSTIVYGIDSDNRITDMVASAMKLPDSTVLPIFVIADTFGRVVFASQGYTIGLGEQMLQIINKL